MGWIVVIEENAGVVADINEALTQIDPKLTTVNFGNSTDFLAWMDKLQALAAKPAPELVAKLAVDATPEVEPSQAPNSESAVALAPDANPAAIPIAEPDPALTPDPELTIDPADVQESEPALDPPLPNDNFVGLITSIETWKFKDVRLIGKFKALFVQRKLAEKEDDLFVIFTGYETPHFQKRRFEYKSVNNFLFKPLDKLLLKQMLDIALKGRQAIKTHYTHMQKIARQIEMLKEIQLIQIGELSFKTKSEQKIEIGPIAKYYADFLETKNHRSAMAQVISYEPSNGQTSAHAKLRFFALDQTQSFNVQKLAQKLKTTHTLDGAKAPTTEYEFIFVKHESSGLTDEVMPAFERFYDHPVTTVVSLAEFDKKLNERPMPEPTKKLFVFLDHQLIAGNEAGGIDSIRNTHPDRHLALFILSPRIFSEELEMELCSRCEDIFYAPFNRSYIVKGLKQRWTDLANKEDLFESVRDVEQTIHVSTPVQLVEVSEAGLTLSYRKEIPIGSFREFVLWMPHEIEVPTLLAQCNFVEKASDGKSVNCHFIFFGLHEHELKFVRRWMLLQYVAEKQKGESA
jgi:hypothetical protein